MVTYRLSQYAGRKHTLIFRLSFFLQCFYILKAFQKPWFKKKDLNFQKENWFILSILQMLPSPLPCNHKSIIPRRPINLSAYINPPNVDCNIISVWNFFFSTKYKIVSLITARIRNFTRKCIHYPTCIKIYMRIHDSRRWSVHIKIWKFNYHFHVSM